MYLLRVAVVTPLFAMCLGGCGAVGESEAADVSARFYQAYRSGDGATACEELAPSTKSELEQSSGKSCAEAVLEEDVPQVGEPVHVEVFGTQARVDYGSDTAFLARFQGGWKVMAVSCKPQPGLPYDCAVSGG